MDLKLRKSTLDIVMLCLSFYEVSIIPHGLFLAMKYVIILYILIIHINELHSLKSIVSPLILYGGVTVFSTLLNQNSANKYVASLIYALHLLAIYLAIYSFVKSRTISELIRVIINTCLCLLIVTDTLMLFVNYHFYSSSERYFIGDKFAVSYLHCFIAMLINWEMLKNTKNKNIYKRTGTLAFAIFAILICIKVNCTTGMLICMFLVVMIYIPISQPIKDLMANPKVIILALAVVNFLIFGSYGLLTNPVVAEFVSNILGKSGTWIGRINIYKIVVGVILEKPLIGYGYFSNIIDKIMGFGNAQNGIFKILVDSGVIGLLGYVLLVYRSMNAGRDLAKKAWPLVVFIYCMAIASIAEINLTDYLFFMTCAISFVICLKDENSGGVRL